MKTPQIKNILVPTDFSKTGLLAVEHAAFMARLNKASLYLFHSIELSASAYTIYNEVILASDFKAIEDIAKKRLNELAAKIKKDYGLAATVICGRGKAAVGIVDSVKDYSIDLVVMGTHGASGFDELFIGSNASRTVALCPCPVITIQSHSKKQGFTNIVLPIDDCLHSRQKVDYAISIAKIYAAKIHILGLIDKKDPADPSKFQIKLESVEKAIKKSGLTYETKVVKADSLAVTAMSYSKKAKADLIVVLTDHESKYDGKFLGVFSKQIVNHSRIPVLSIRPAEGVYDSISLAGSNSI